MKKFLFSAGILLLVLGSVSITQANLIVNGDFEGGNSAFGSDLGYVAPPSTLNANGYYTIDINPHNHIGVWADMTDHTTGSGLMLIATPEAWATPEKRVWFQDVDVVEGTEYVFEGWTAHITSSNPAKLSFKIDGSSIGSLDLQPYNSGQWNSFSFSWTADLTGSVNLSIVDLQATGIGNDFALDDLSFQPVPIPGAVWLLGSGLIGFAGFRKRFKRK